MSPPLVSLDDEITERANALRAAMPMWPKEDSVNYLIRRIARLELFLERIAADLGRGLG